MMDINYSSEVRDALKTGKPVVALESTVFSPLGLPSPANREAYSQSLEAVQEKGAVAAVTAVIDGLVKVGLSKSDEAHLFGESITQAEKFHKVSTQPSAARSAESKPMTEVATFRKVSKRFSAARSAESKPVAEVATFRKVSTANLPIAVAQSLPFGATTVSASLSLAHQAGIKIFATGGIGGVHRENPNDVSADLAALARFPVATVCSGAKAFLDLPATLERLETLGVPVVGYGTGEFPAFWCQESGLELQHSVATPKEAADIVRALGSEQGSPGVLFVVPPPKEKALQWPVVEQAVEEALAAVPKQGIKGGEVTPFILERINQATNGGTLPANIALVANNAAVAADLAVALVDNASTSR